MATDPLSEDFENQVMSERITALGAAPVVSDLGGEAANALLFQQLVSFLGGSGAGKTKFRVVNADTTFVIDSDEIIVCDTSLGAIQVNLPLASSIPADGFVRQGFIVNMGGQNPVNVMTTAPETFPRGNTSIRLNQIMEVLHVGGMPAPINGWGNVASVEINDVLRLATPFPAASFAVPTAVPFDTIVREDDPAILMGDIAIGPTQGRITALVPLEIEVAYFIDINSTGGGTWNATADLRVNGVSAVGSKLTSGNFGNEDQSTSLPKVPVSLAAGQFIELFIAQTSLTGNLANAGLIVNTQI